MKKNLLLSALLCISLYAQDSHALRPETAATLAEKIEKQDQSPLEEGFIMISENIAYPIKNSTYQLNAQLWLNTETNEAVIVFHTPKEKGILALRGLARRFFGFEDTIKYTREQGRLYNKLVRSEGHEYLAGGTAQKAAAIVADYASWGLLGAGRGATAAAKSVAGAVGGYLWPKTADLQQPENPEAAVAEVQEPEVKMIDSYFTEAVMGLYDTFKSDLKNFDGQLFLVGHSLAGYVAQYMAYTKNLDGYSFASMGLGLPEPVDTDKTFVNIVRKNDHFGDLHHHHYGSLKRIQDLPVTKIADLDTHKNKLAVADSIPLRYKLMGEYLTKNHAIEGYADQLAQFASPDGSPRIARRVPDMRGGGGATTTTTTTTQQPVGTTTAAAAAAATAPIAPPPPPVSVSSRATTTTAAPTTTAASVSSVAPPPPPQPSVSNDNNAPQQSSGGGGASVASGLAGALQLIQQGGVKLRKTDTKIAEGPGKVVEDDPNMDPLEKQYRSLIKRREYQPSGKNYMMSATMQDWYNEWKKDPYYMFDVAEADKNEADIAKRKGILAMLKAEFRLKD